MNGKRSKQYKLWTAIVLFLIIAIPLLLKIPLVRSVISMWLYFSDNPDYKIAYIELVGGLLGTFLSVLGALRIENYLREQNAEHNRREYVNTLYVEMERCFKKLKDIHDETILNNYSKFRDLSTDDFNNFCDAFSIAAQKHRLNLNCNYITMLSSLHGHIDLGLWNNLQKYFSRLSVIDQALESGDNEKIRMVVIPYVYCFINEHDNGKIHGNIEIVMRDLRKLLR